MSGYNSRQRRKLAVNTAREAAYGKDVSGIIKDFDECQMRIYYKYLPQFQMKAEYFDELDKDMWLAYTGKPRPY